MPSKPSGKRRPKPRASALYKPRAVKTGRPTDYKPALCEQVIKLGALGKSKTQIAARLGVVRQTLENWQAVHAEFLDAMTRAGELAMAWWEEQGQDGVWAGSQFNSSAWSRSMAARFPDHYREVSRHELSGPGGRPMLINSTMSQAEAAQAYAATLNGEGG